MSSSNKKSQRILLPTSNGFTSFWIKDLIYFESHNIYSYINYQGKNIFCGLSLKNLEQLLNSKEFYRCHKSFIVNINNIVNIPKGTANHLTMSSGKSVPFSRRKNNEFWNHIRLHSPTVNEHKHSSNKVPRILVAS